MRIYRRLHAAIRENSLTLGVPAVRIRLRLSLSFAIHKWIYEGNKKAGLRIYQVYCLNNYSQIDETLQVRFRA